MIQKEGCPLVDPVPWGYVLLGLTVYSHFCLELLTSNSNMVHTGLNTSLKNYHILEKSLKMTNLEFLFW